MQSQDTGIGTSFKDIQQELKKKEIVITHLTSSIQDKREQMRNLSNQITKMIEKQVLFPRSPHDSYFYPNNKDSQISSLYQTREQIWNNLNSVKEQIKKLRNSQEPQVVQEILRKKPLLDQTMKKIKKQEQQKHFLERKMEQNKQKIEYLKNSTTIRDIESEQQTLYNIKREIKQLEKQMYDMENEDIQRNMFTFELKEKIQKQEENHYDKIDKQIINEAMEELQKLLDDKKKRDKRHDLQVQEINQQIEDFYQQNAELSTRIRIIKNNLMQRQLEQKRVKNRKRKPSNPNLQTQQQPTKFIEKRPPPPVHQPEEVVMDFQQTQKFEPKKPFLHDRYIIIGQWNKDRHIRDDIVEDPGIQRAVGIKFRVKNNGKLVGVGVTYVDHMGVEIFGRGNIWKGEVGKDEKQIAIQLENVVELHYSDNDLSMKWVLNDSTTIQIGTPSSKHPLNMPFTTYFIHTVEFSLSSNFQSVESIKLNLFHHQQQRKPLKSYSYQDLAAKKKKVFLKNKSTMKKYNQVPIVDHRLMINRKKKMV